MARFDKPWTQSLRGATLSVESPTPETLFRAIATQLVESRRSSTPALRQNRQRLITLLDQIPCLDNFDCGEAEFECWWVSFDLDISSTIAWRVIYKLGLLLNTRCSSKLLSVTFKPLPRDGATQALRWEIASTAPGVDPTEVARWLRENLPQAMSDEAAWVEEE